MGRVSKNKERRRRNIKLLVEASMKKRNEQRRAKLIKIVKVEEDYCPSASSPAEPAPSCSSNTFTGAACENNDVDVKFETETQALVDVKTKEEVHSPEKQHEEPFLPLEGSGNHCLLCYYKPHGQNSSKRISEQSESGGCGSELKENTNMIFLLRRILEVPTEQLSALLKSAHRGLREWIRLCSECQSLVREALDVNAKILKLFEELNECKRKIVKKMKITFRDKDNSARRHGTCLTCRKFGCEGGHRFVRVTDEIRKFVFKRKYSIKSHGFAEGDHQAEIAMKELIAFRASCPEQALPKKRKYKERRKKPEIASDPSQFSPKKKRKKLAMKIRQLSITRLSNLHPAFPKRSNSIKRHPIKVPPKRMSVERKSDKRKFLCPACPRLKAVPVDQFVQHILFHFVRPFQCSQCGVYLTENEANSNAHWKNFHAGLEGQDGDGFRRITIKRHEIMESPLGIPVFQEEDLEGDDTIDVPSQDCSVGIMTCPTCGKRFVSEDVLKLHFTLEHPQVAGVSCYHCFETFKNSDGLLDDVNLRLHMKSLHPSVHLYDRRLNLCTLCGKTWCTKKRVTEDHMETDHPNYIHAHCCQFCQELFSSRKQLEGHTPNCPSNPLPPPQMEEEECPWSDAGISDDDDDLEKDEHETIKSLPGNCPSASTAQFSVELTKTYPCSMCLLSGMPFDAFTVHLLFHKQRPFKCTECSTFLQNDEDAVANHWSRFHADCATTSIKYKEVPFSTGKVWECRKCEETFCSEADRNEHHLCFHNCEVPEDDKTHNCSHCSKAFQTLEEWRLHRITEHPKKAEFSCLICDTSFAVTTVEGVETFTPTKDKAIQAHMRNSHNTDQKRLRFDICSFCGKTFRFSGGAKVLLSHLQEVHKIPEAQLFPCPVCPQDKIRAYKTKNCLNSHLKLMHFQRKYVCDVCGWRGPSVGRLSAHQFAQHKIRPEEGVKYTCTHEGCSFEAMSKQRFSEHVAGHSELRPYICRFCGSAFKQKGKLAEHEKIHANAETKPFQCELCGNSFAVRTYLYIHKRLSHEGRFFPSTFKKKPGGSRKSKKGSSKSIPEEEGSVPEDSAVPSTSGSSPNNTCADPEPVPSSSFIVPMDALDFQTNISNSFMNLI